jgi:hypothetical protein
MLPNLLVDENSEEDEGSGAEQQDFQDSIDFVKALHEALHFSSESWGAKKEFTRRRRNLVKV